MKRLNRVLALCGAVLLSLPADASQTAASSHSSRADSNSVGSGSSTATLNYSDKNSRSQQGITSGAPLSKQEHIQVVLTAPQYEGAIASLRAKDLGLPIKGADVQKMKGSFYEMRGGSRHEAVDILEPRNTPVYAIENGTVAKLFTSRFGGLTIYQFEPSGKFVYYYAHLERYEDNLHDGDSVKKGQVIGYVGTSGNAPPSTPHLHFSISVIDAQKRWWQAAAVDPYEVFAAPAAH